MASDLVVQVWLWGFKQVQARTSQSNCWQISIAAVFCPSSRRLFMLLAR